MADVAPKSSKSGRNAALVAAGILASRVMGLVRNKLFAHFLGNGLEASAFAAATRIPNILQNLLGEGVLSASLIPVYAGLRSKKQDDEAERVAGAVFGLLTLAVGVLVAIGLVAAPTLVRWIAPGYEGEQYELTVTLVRYIFPGTGILVLSAWCLGILNSHKKFFLSYVAPVVWNLCIIAALFVFRHEPRGTLIHAVAVATVAGSVLQFVVQLPVTLRLLGRFRPTPSLALPSVRRVVTDFLPAVAARGVVQVSAYVDLRFASWIAGRAVSVLNYSQTIALLPVSLFGMSISAAELPDLSTDALKSDDERAKALRERLQAALARMSFFVVPSAVAFVALGDLIAGALLQSGAFTASDSRLTWYILLGSGVALFAQTRGRLYSSAFYALKDTRTPFRFAAVRVTLGIALGYVAVFQGPTLLGLPAELGVAFITATTSASAWLESLLLRAALQKRIGVLAPVPKLAVLWGCAFAAAALALGVKYGLGAAFGTVPLADVGGALLPPPALPATPVSVGILGVFGVNYFLLTFVTDIAQSRALVGRVFRRRGQAAPK